MLPDGVSRKIIHCDCDCFYAAIEVRDDPSLAGRPVGVGGRPEARGVIATCNYEARAFGVHSAMSTAQALRLCPQLILLRPRFDAYREASRRILAIYREFTALVEPLSLDEAYLDVTGVGLCRGSASLMAEEIRRRIRAEVGITASAGIAPNKFLAKVASDWNKPDGQFVVRPQEVDGFVAALPVTRIHGVGKVTAEKLNGLGVGTCGDLRRWSEAELGIRFGSFGARLYRLCRGEDPRPVVPRSRRKSLSVETTYARDLPHLDACREALPALVGELEQRLKRAGAPDVEKLFVKIRFDDFRHTTAEGPACGVQLPRCLELLGDGWRRHGRPVRLLGVGVRLRAVDENAGQLALFD
ncbi:MAG: DNA polymerase IV [Rhodocyclaceae bacterium]|nr:DNA polymerase IV [Rhodocyclaceae bacterium]